MANCLSCKKRRAVDGYRCQPCLDRLQRILEGSCARLTQALGIPIVAVRKQPATKRRAR